MLGEYIKSLQILHSFGESEDDLNILETAVNNDQTVNNTLLDSVTIERRTVISQVTKKIRDVSFKSRVLTAYGGACSFCGIQLKLIDAAHILPVERNGSDETWNGIALCALHHRAYDRSLVTFDENYRIILNEKALENLRIVGHIEGRRQFESNLRNIIILPPAVTDRPHAESIIQANEIRGWA
jgi:putative restriction endonuclease